MERLRHHVLIGQDLSVYSGMKLIRIVDNHVT